MADGEVVEKEYIDEEPAEIEARKNKYNYDDLIAAINNELTPDEQELFYQLSWNNTSIKKTKDKQIEITKLKIKIKEIKDKQAKSMTELEQYTQLLKLEDKLLFFNQYNEVTLEQSDYTILKELYKVYYNKFSALNVTCSSCVSEMLNICLSRYSALKKQFDKVAEPAPLENTEVDADGIITMTDTFQPPSLEFSTDFKKELRDAKVEADKLKVGRFEAPLEYLKKCLISINAKLDNETFVANAPSEVITNERNKKKDAEAKIEKIKAKMAIESEIKKVTKKKTK